MDKRTQDYLHLHVEELPDDGPPPVEELPALSSLCRTFTSATGWPIEFVSGTPSRHDSDLLWSAPVDPGEGTAPGHFRIGRRGRAAEGPQPQVNLESAKLLAADLALVINELAATQQALWRREAELAAGVPVMPRSDEAEHLAERLEAILRGGAEAVGCQAAAMYLLDDATSELKLRALWGLPRRRLAEPARPLRGAAGDLEALVGHVVVLGEDTAQFPGWKIPDGFRTAVCVPISTPSIPLGTLWLYCHDRRDFNDNETNIIEIIAGRLSTELEREMLLAGGQQTALANQSLDAAGRWQQNQLPRITPLVEGVDLAGWTRQTGIVGGDFYDYFPLSDGSLGIAVGDALSTGVDAALLAAEMHGALRALAQRRLSPAQLVSRVNSTIWTTSVGDQSAALFYAVIDPTSGRLRYASAGDLVALHFRGDDADTFAMPTAPLGTDPDTRYRQTEIRLEAGEILLIASDGVREARDEGGRILGCSGLVDAIGQHRNASADSLVEIVRHRLQQHSPEPADDQTILVLRRGKAD